MVTAFHGSGLSSVTDGVTPYLAAWSHMNESLYSQDFMGLSKWQLENPPGEGSFIILA